MKESEIINDTKGERFYKALLKFYYVKKFFSELRKSIGIRKITWLSNYHFNLISDRASNWKYFKKTEK